MSFRRDDIIFLFGAGVSREADIPMSSKMIDNVEELIQANNDWYQYKDLYNLIKSAIRYADGIQGKESINRFDIERLYNVLNELIKKEEHPLYPFIGSWNIRFNEIIKDDFEKIKTFQRLILDELKKWVDIRFIDKANYFRSLKDFRIQYNNPLRIFTLNYDLCIEKTLNSEVKIERGFNDEHKWDYKLITDYHQDNTPDVFLYKLHGSIDWERDEETGEVSYLDGLPKEPDLIFGSEYKLQYIDPYLFQFSEFRHYTLKSKLIIIVGYGFGDEHINGILTQSLKQSSDRKLLFVSPDASEEINKIRKALNLSDDSQIETLNVGAKEFFENKLKIEEFEKYFPDLKEEDIWD
jgi:hypothetical protein